MEKKNRCSWCLKDELYMDYHDTVWGIPEYDDQKLFEFINLEGAQAGLSWYTILCRIENYKKVFLGWDPEKIVAMSAMQLEEIRHDSRIIRNKLKIHAVQDNARAYLLMKDEGIGFSDFLWSYVDGEPIRNKFSSMSEIPSQTKLSVQISKDLKKKGFKFVGPTIVYAFMQAVGMVDDHLQSCWKRQL